MKEYLKDLNQAQQSAVVNTKGPALVIAGAGSGKTRVLTYRITHMLDNGVKAYKVLALTFTNKAAKEMKERIATMIGMDKARSLWMGTFHSIFARILRSECKALGYPSNFTIYDSADSKSLIKTIIKELRLDDKIYKPNEVLGRISSAKNNLITSNAYGADPKILQTDASTRKPEIHKIYDIYAKRCFRSGAMDFDDLLLQTNILFRDHPEVLEKYQNKFDYILVDEYQDTNFSQYLIIKKLSAKHHNICVVGDDAQSIYAFRGAKIENILNFQKDYPNNKVYKLEQNYRSTQTIVNAANSIIAKNKLQLQKKVFSENEVGNKIKVIDSQTDREEGFLIANSILDSHFVNQNEYKDFAILYRTNAQSRIFEESLRKRSIPYKIYGGLSFYQRKEIKDLLSYCRLIANPQDDEALKRIINYPKRGIGNTTVGKLEEGATAAAVPIWEYINNIQTYGTTLGAATVKKILNFVSFLQQYMSKKDTMDAYSLVSEIVTEAGIIKDLSTEKTQESISRFENVQELLNGIKEFSEQKDLEQEELTLEKYLEEVSLLTNDDNDEEGNMNKVLMMTIHSAKGLEFNNVYIVGCEENLFPSGMSVNSEKDIEEERRLFYVAVTRAQKELTLSFARLRYRWGKLDESHPSRFVSEIAPEFLEEPADQFGSFGMPEPDTSDTFKRSTSTAPPPQNGKTAQSLRQNRRKSAPGAAAMQGNKKLINMKDANRKNTAKQQIQGEANHDYKGLKPGSKVEHLRFGVGIVKELEGNFPDTKAVIEFENSGRKVLLLKFAKIKIVG